MTVQREERGTSHPASTRFHVGIDLAWADKNESGIVMLDPAGNVAAAGWTVGVDATVAWLDNHAPVDALLFVDAPLVVNNETGQRRCEKQVGPTLRALEGLCQLHQPRIPSSRRCGPSERP